MSKWPLTAAAVDVHKRLLLQHMSASLLLLLRMSKGSLNQICIKEGRASDSTRRRRHRRIAIVILNI